MTDFGSAVATVCAAAAASGLFRLIAPENKFQKQLSFLVACLFAVCVLSALSGTQLSFEEMTSVNVPAVDMSGRLTESARLAAEKAVENETQGLLYKNGISCLQINAKANIDDSLCISISEIELVFDSDISDGDAARAVRIVREKAGDDITVYSVKGRGRLP